MYHLALVGSGSGLPCSFDVYLTRLTRVHILQAALSKFIFIIFIYDHYNQHIYDSVNERNSLHITAVKALV